MTNRIRFSAFYAFILVVLSGSYLGAQTSSREVSLAVGAMGYDASGTGTVPVGAIRAATPLGAQWLLGEISLSYAAMDEQFSTANTRIGVGEAQLQVQLPWNRVRPYVGVGGGWLHYFNNSVGSLTRPTYSASAGLRVPVASRLLARGEFRLRGWETSSGSGAMNSAGEFTAGIGYSF